MSDEIKQQLGFDVGDALAALEKLDTGLAGLQTGLSNTAESMGTWNAKAGSTVQMLKDLASGATSAAAAMAKLHAAFSGSAAGSPGNPIGPNIPVAPAAVAPPPPPPPLPPITPPISPTPIVDSEKAAAKFIVTWQTLSRVIMTQLIVRALSAMRDAFHEAFESNLQFMTRIAEIQSIGPGVGESLDGIAHRVANLSREFNVPLAQVAEAQYQTLSNQFTSASQQSDVLTAAMKLSKVAVMDAGHAVNLIAGALNAYHMESTQAESVAASFFATIQIGRVRGEELASVMSKVYAVSSQLGVSLQEVNSMMVAMTVSGVKPAEAATAERAAMMALLKPSADLKKELHELGYESGQQMIEALGLEGALLKLRSSTDENVAAFVKLIPNVRALGGALIETSDGGKKVADAVQHMREMTVEAFNQKYKIYIESDAQKVSADLNKLKVALTTDLGASMVSAVRMLFGWAGGADAVSAAFKAMLPMVVAAGGAFVLYAAYLAAASMAHTLLTAKMTLTMGVLAGLTAALLIYAAIDYGHTRHMQEIEAQAAAFHKASDDRLANDRAEAQARIDIEREVNEETARMALQGLAEQRKGYFDMVDGIKEANKSLQESSHATMGSLIEGAEKQVHQLREVATHAEETIQSIEKAKISIRDKMVDSAYRSQVSSVDSGLKARLREIDQMDLSGYYNSANASKRKSQLREEAEDYAEARKKRIAANLADQFMQRAGPSEAGLESAKRAEHYASLAGNEKLVQSALEKQLSIENQLEAIAAKRAAWASKKASDEELLVKTMRESAKQITADMDLFNKKGEAMKPEDRAATVARVQSNMALFQTALFASQKFDASQFMSFQGLKDKLITTMNGAVTATEVKNLWTAPATLAKLNEQITMNLGPIRLKLLAQLEHPEQWINATYEEIDRQRQLEIKRKPETIGLSQEQLASEKKALGEIRTEQQAITAEVARQRKPKELGEDLWVGAGRLFSGEVFKPGQGKAVEDAGRRFASLNDEVKRMSAEPLNLTAEAMAKVVAEAAKLKKDMPSGFGDEMVGLDRNLASLQKIFEKQQDINKGRRQTPHPEQVIETGEEEMSRMRARNMMRELEDLKGKTSQIETPINADAQAMLGFEERINIATRAMQDLAVAAASVPAPGGGGFNEDLSAEYSAKGGMAYLAGGGHPRGTDMIPAMLSKGEMVMSAATTRKFASQLTAMNAGVKPSYHSHGGVTTNIGDINVTVAGGGTGRQTARAIATELRRELRRGTSVL